MVEQTQFEPTALTIPARHGQPVRDLPLFEGPREDPRLISNYLWTLRRHRWKMLVFIAATVAAVFLVTSRIKPSFESTVTIDVDRQSPSGVIGQEASRSALNDSDQFLATQIRLVQSDAVLRPVSERYNLLDIEGQMKDAPQASKDDVRRSPVALRKLRVTRPPNTYLMLVSYRSHDPNFSAEVANAIAKSYLEHTFRIRIGSSASVSSFMERQLEELKGKMERSSQALSAFERDMNVINPEEKTSILTARLLQLNNEFTSAQADRLRKQAAWESVRSGSVASAQVSQQGDSLRKLYERLTEARENFGSVQAQYGSNHPEYRKAQSRLTEVNRSIELLKANIAQRVEIEYHEALGREEMLATTVAATKQEFDSVNARSFEYQALKREADADRKLYEELVRKIREAGINAGFQNSSIRIADSARPALKPVSPNMSLNLLLGLLFATILAVGGALLADGLDRTIRDPDQVTRTLGTQVVGTLPLLRPGVRRLLSLGERGAVAVQGDEASGFHESIRTLRNSILLGDLDHRYRTLLVTSAAPSEGKTTTAAHLAAAHAEQGKRTLLIDGDLRRPSVHRIFQLPGLVGLSNVLLGELPWRDALVRKDDLPSLDILPAGPPSRRASDLIGGSLVELLEDAASCYDLVILDAPPLLGFAEPLQMATSVDGVVIVARAGQTSRKSLASVVETLNRMRTHVVGLVLNEVHKDLSESYYYYGYYKGYATPEGKS
ncbi:MAG: polysaccharide biosynthesis tyrosine autokinase [Bryobacteraceae bacterium]|nr:polysaccharide biosynthesis tyrosine autokinase [Bryobacteraceae bacterium]